MTVTFTDEEREQILTTLAFVACDRPYLDAALRSVAAKFGDQGATMYDAFKYNFSPDRPPESARSVRPRRRESRDLRRGS